MSLIRKMPASIRSIYIAIKIPEIRRQVVKAEAWRLLGKLIFIPVFALAIPLWLLGSLLRWVAMLLTETENMVAEPYDGVRRHARILREGTHKLMPPDEIRRRAYGEMPPGAHPRKPENR